MKQFRKINKKGFVQAITDTGIALIIILIGLLLMSLLTKSVEKRQTENGDNLLKEARAENLFALYLKQPVVVDQNTISISDLIILTSASDIKSPYNPYLKTLKEYTEEFFVKYDSTKQIDGLTISIDDVVIYNSVYSKNLQNEISINLPNKEKLVSVKLSYSIIKLESGARKSPI